MSATLNYLECQLGEANISHVAAFERDGNRFVDVGVRRLEACRCRVDDLLELDRVAFAARVDSLIAIGQDVVPGSTTLGNSWHSSRCSPSL